MLSKRLQSLTKYINKEDKIIDVGCDHALLDIYLIKNGYLNKMIASDIHKSAYQQGLNNINHYKMNDYIDIRLGDGLNVLNDNDSVDTLLISGMGSNTIIDIIDNQYMNDINKIIIQSNNDYELLRRTIIDKGYIIDNEEFFVDKGINYINIVFIKGNKEYTDDEIKYGPILIHNKEYLEYELSKINNIIDKIPEDKKEIMSREINTLKNYIQMT